MRSMQDLVQHFAGNVGLYSDQKHTVLEATFPLSLLTDRVLNIVVRCQPL
jgi:hypothetical protein